MKKTIIKTIKTYAAILLALVMLISAPTVYASENYRVLDLSDRDIELISRAVCIEGAERSYLAKACIASMIFNRMKDDTLRRTMPEAIYERGAFIRAKAEDIEGDLPDDALDECETLVRLVYLYGIDPTCGALFSFLEGDADAEDFKITLSVDGFVFARP